MTLCRGWPCTTDNHKKPRTQLLPNNLLNLNSSASFYHFRSNWKASTAKKRLTWSMAIDQFLLLATLAFFVDPGKLKRTTTFLRHQTAFFSSTLGYFWTSCNDLQPDYTIIPSIPFKTPDKPFEGHYL